MNNKNGKSLLGAILACVTCYTTSELLRLAERRSSKHIPILKGKGNEKCSKFRLAGEIRREMKNIL